MTVTPAEEPRDPEADDAGSTSKRRLSRALVRYVPAAASVTDELQLRRLQRQQATKLQSIAVDEAAQLKEHRRNLSKNAGPALTLLLLNIESESLEETRRLQGGGGGVL
jgi:hypothetical protein